MKKTNYMLIFLCLISVISIDIGRIYPINSSVEIEASLEPKAATPYTLHIGAWIIVAGDRESDHSLYYCIEQGCNDVYNIIINLGWNSADIRYLACDWDGSLPPNAYAESTRVNIEDAITSWAAGKVSSTNALGIYLFDHGGVGGMALPGPSLYDTNLNNYLNALEVSTGMTRSVIIYEACHSGSFINPVSKEGRIIITATDIDHGSYPNPACTHAVFSEHFWAALSMGYRLGYCFEYATECVEIWGLDDIQKPWIDDNHDEIGHEVDPYWEDLPNGGDGSDALDISLGTPLPIFKFLHFLKVFLPKYIPRTAISIPIWAVIDNHTDVEFVRARVFPEWWKWPEPRVSPDEGISYFSEDDFSGIPSFDLTYDPESSEDGEFNYSTSLSVRQYTGLFGQGGDNYKILFEAKKEDGSPAKPVETKVILNEDGKAPDDETPPTVQITNPALCFNITSSMIITVEADDDQALDTVQILMDNIILTTENMPTYYPYPEVSHILPYNVLTKGEHNITAIAVDKAGNEKQTSVKINVIKGGTSIPGFNLPTVFISSFIGVIVILVKRKNK
ncbi:MAG: C13 family peptidase [Promethearchaeota archaeon]